MDNNPSSPSYLSQQVESSRPLSPAAQEQSNEERTNYILDTFLHHFSNEMRENPKGWRGRFRKMIANEFSFYRGSAVLFYRDIQRDLTNDPWLQNNSNAANIFIHGDLHAENFGTYIDRYGIINFDVNDFDEGYIGPFIWDVKRLATSLNLIAYAKAYSDENIMDIIRRLVRSYLKQINEYCNSNNRDEVAITSENTHGPVNILLKESRLGSKEAALNVSTTVENYERQFIRSKNVKDVDTELRHQIILAFQNYLSTIPTNKKEKHSTYKIKDIVSRTSSGIGSAGRTSYSILIQGKTQALETDTVIFMKPATTSAVASVIKDPNIQSYFRHNGLRTALCAYAMHAATSKWLGYATLNDTVQLVVDEVATHSKNLEWDEINDFDEMCDTVEFLGKAMAKIHCVCDIDSIQKVQQSEENGNLLPFDIIPKHTEENIRKAIDGNDEAFVEDIIAFAMTYGNQVRRDHQLFFEVFRSGNIPILDKN